MPNQPLTRTRLGDTLAALQTQFKDIVIPPNIIEWVTDVEYKLKNNINFKFIKQLPKERL